MVEYETKSELLRMSMVNLKQIAKKYGVTGYSKYTASEKEDLVKVILKVINKRKKDGSAPPPRKNVSRKGPSAKAPSAKAPSAPRKHPQATKAVRDERRAEVNAKLPLGLSCDMDQQRCKTSSEFNLEDIIRLAHFCGVSTKGKTRYQLCRDIEASVSQGTEEIEMQDMSSDAGSDVEPDEWGEEGQDWEWEYEDEDGNPIDAPDEEEEEGEEEEEEEEPEEEPVVRNRIEISSKCVNKQVIVIWY